jgi:hypothetical protein
VFLERSAALALDRRAGAERTLGAAQAHQQVGTSDATLKLLAMAEASPLDEL